MRVENLLIVRGEGEALALMKGDYQDSGFDRGDGRRDEGLRGICVISLARVQQNEYENTHTDTIRAG